MWILLLAGCPGPTDLIIADTAFFVDDFVETGESYEQPCLTDEQGAILGDWLYQQWLVAYGAPAQASASQVIAYYQLPGVAAAPWFRLDLAQACAAPADLDPVCTQGVCYQVECTGVGGGWVNHVENDDDKPGSDITVTEDGWVIERGRTPVAWAEGSGRLDVTLDIKGLHAPDGTDWTHSGAAMFDGTLTLVASFPGLHPGGLLEVDIAADNGEVRVGDSVIAVWASQTLTAQDCWAED